MFHAFIWLSEKIKHNHFWKKKIVGPYCSKCWNWEFWTYFFHWNECFCYYTASKVPKKVPLGTSTEFQVLIPVPYQFKCERYPTLVQSVFFLSFTDDKLLFPLSSSLSCFCCVASLPRGKRSPIFNLASVLFGSLESGGMRDERKPL